MASFDKLPSGRWRAQVRRKGQHASRTFRLKSEAEAWAREAEDNLERGKSVDAVQVDSAGPLLIPKQKHRLLPVSDRGGRTPPT